MPILPRRTPASLGVDGAGVGHFLDAVAAEEIELHSMMLVRHGAVAAEGWWAPYDADTPHLLYSLSKSFVSIAVGLAAQEGLVRLDERLVERFADLAPSEIDERVGRITLEQCLRMATGHAGDTVWPVIRRCGQRGAGDWLTAFLALPPEHEPGTVFAYNQLATYAAARTVEAATGQTVLDFLGPRLLEPLGIGPAGWLTDALGHDWGFSGLHLTTEAIAAVGQLLLHDGVWQGRRLLPAGWVEQATRSHTATDASNRDGADFEPSWLDWLVGYGHQFWRSRHGYRADGAYGQFCLVLPEHDAVLALTAATDRLQSVLDLVWEHLLPGFGEPGGDDSADHMLAERLRGLAIAPPTDDRTGVPGHFARAGAGGPRALTAVALAGTVSDYTLTFDDEGEFAVPVGSGRWLPGTWPANPDLSLMSAGGWRDGRFVAHVRFIQTPHLLRLTLDPPTGSFRAIWREQPLHGSDPATMATPIHRFPGTPAPRMAAPGSA